MNAQLAPQAAQQRSILFTLAAGPSPSIIALAASIGSARPSVSRSLKALAGRGLVESRGRSWFITPAGRAEIEQLGSRLTPGVLRALTRQAGVDREAGLTLTRLARELAGPTNVIGAVGPSSAISDAINQLSVLPSSMFGSNLMAGMDKLGGANLIGAVGPSSAISDAINQLSVLPSSMFGSNLMAGMDKLGGARIEAFSSLRLQLSALSVQPQWWTPMVADNMSFSARIASDLASMTTALSGPSHLAKAHSDSIQSAVGRLVTTHRELLETSLAQIMSGPAFPGAPNLVISPTAATAAITGTARGIVLPASRHPDSADLLREALMDVAAQLEAVGASATARDLAAAWDVLKRRQLGWSKAASHLIRETIREALDELASPDVVPPDEEGVVTKRRQVLWIVGDSATLADWVDVFASSVGRLHSVLSAEAKNSKDPREGWQGLLGLLESTTGMLRILADHASRRLHT